MVDKECIFCKIASGDIPAATVYEDTDFRAILDLGPASRGHTLILPKEHYKDICDLDSELASRVLPLAAKLGEAMKKAFGCAGFNIVQNNGRAAGQTVFHFHTHIIPRYENGPDMVSWSPQTMLPEESDKIAYAIKQAMEA